MSDFNLPTGETRPASVAVRTLLYTLALVLCVGFFGMRPGAARHHLATYDRPLTASDTDSVAVDADFDVLRLPPPAMRDSARADTGAVDSTETDSVVASYRRAERYLPVRRPSLAATLAAQTPQAGYALPGAWQRTVTLDSTERVYRVREQVGGSDVRVPVSVGFDTYAQARFEQGVNQQFRDLMAQRERAQSGARRGGPLFNVVIPGGRQSAFSTIFGKNEVSLRVNGQANINAGFDYRKSEQQAVLGRPSQLDPTFKQDLSLAINGTIGDKLRVDVSWDTQSQFDYQNQLKLQYTGYEDEIIQSIEAGNVFLQTPSSLIRGGQSLFGIKSQFKVGGVRLTTVASQQEGQSSALNISGGAESVKFDLKATDYDPSTHFFLSYYFRNNWETALSQPPRVLLRQQDALGRAGVEKIIALEVWRLQRVEIQETNSGVLVAMADLGEEQAIVQQQQGTPYDKVVSPSPAIDQYSDDEIENNLRRSGQDVSAADFLVGSKGLDATDFQTGRFKRLELGRDYTLDPTLGFISLKQRLADNEAIAVAFRYQTTTGQVVQVGDFSGASGGTNGQISQGALVTKLLRGTNPVAPSASFVPATWYLEMRNIYSLRGGGIRPDDFKLAIEYRPSSGAQQETLPGSRTPLLQQLGLDRIGAGGAPGADNLFDYINNYTIDAERGLLFFPYLEPFGARITEVTQDNPNTQQLAFTQLYTTKQETARNQTQFDIYRINGSYQGSAQSFFDLKAWSGLVEGSVRVLAGGVTLTEGADYTVDYTGSGTLNIINQAYVNAGRDIEITYEQNSLFDLQKKTLLGARADYAFEDRVQLGATVMRMAQRSQVDKFRIGDEPIANTIWGLDGQFKAEPRWITQAVDALPFLQTRAPSRFDVRGEFAQLRPGDSQTIAFRQTQRDLRGSGFGFAQDELNGVSYVDDFESFENTYSLKAPGAWRLAAAPDSIGAVDGAMLLTGSRPDSLRTNWRGGMAWYQMNQNILRELASLPIRTNPAAINVPRVTDVYPDRPLTGNTGAPETISTFDLYFDPNIRGPYNYSTDLTSFFNQPKNTWGGIITPIPEGYRDFDTKNVEFIEFVIRAFAEGENEDPGQDAYLYVDLGTISEDVLPDQQLSTEDGLSLQGVDASSAFTRWGRVAQLGENGIIDQDKELRRTEDLGLDGLVSYNPDPYDPAATESNFFATFVQALQAQPVNPYHAAEIARSQLDPSGDDYHHYLDDRFYKEEFFPGGATLQQRFLRYFAGHELNSFEGQNEFDVQSAIKRGNSRLPDSEDLNNNSVADRINNYFQYQIPLSKAELDRQGAPGRDDDFVVGEIVGSNGTRTGYYQIRIPVRNFTRRVGTANDFTALQAIRLWTTGHEVPVTLRFATLELVGSQWRKSERVTNERMQAEAAAFDTRYTISSINTEENSRIYRKPIGTVTPINRGLSGAATEAREQSLVLNVERLRPGAQVGIYKVYNNQTLDLLKYSNIRMFAHLHGSDGAGDWTAADRGRVVMFVRFGASESDAYYEYEQPLTPSSELSADANLLWLNDENALNIEIAAFNQLKFARDNRGVPSDSTWYSVIDGQQLPDAPDATRFAPPGTRLGIRGNPSLNRINTIVIGLRNPADSTSADANGAVKQAVLWVNELRVSGYDQTNGWSGLANMDLRLADFASVRAAFSAQTDGFGALTSTLSERDQNALLNWSVNTDFRIDKFIPEQYGWTIPLNVSVQSNTTTPRYSPTRGDVRLDAILDGIDQQDDLSRSEKEARKQQEISAAQTRATSRSLALNGVSKTGSGLAFLRNTLDGISATFATSESEQSSASQRVNDAWRWNTGVAYRLPSQQPKTLRPLWFLDGVPVLGLLGDLRYNYIPTSLSVSAVAARAFSTQRERRSFLNTSARDTLPGRIGYPFREQHTFTHGRDFNLQYNPFSFLRTSFSTGVDQSLSRLGVDTLYNRIELIDNEERITPITRAEALDLEAQNNPAVFVEKRAAPTSFGRVVGRAFSGDDRFRTDGYTQNFTTTISPRLSNKVRWVTFNDLAYNARYTWTNGAIGQDFGAGIRTTVTVGTGITIRPETFWGQFDFFKTLQDEQRKSEAAANARRLQREQETRQRRETRRLEKERRQREEEVRRAREAAGEAPPDSLDIINLEEEGLDADSTGEDLTDPEAPGRNLPVATADTVRATEAEGKGFRIPLPSGRTILRRTILTLGGITDMQVQYTGGLSSSSSNVGENGDGTNTPYSLIDALGGEGPSLGYRFGFTRTVDDEDRVLNESVQVRDNLTDNHKVTARTTLRPSPALTVNLSWDVSWEGTADEVLRREDGDLFRQRTLSGGNRAFVWALGADYGALFERQRDAYLADAAGTPLGSTVGDENSDGRVALTNRSVVDDFLETFTRGIGTIDGRNLLPFPMPAWQVNYTGISKWPLIRSIAQSATLRHNYSADYSSAYRSNPEGSPSSTFRLGGRTVAFELPLYEASSVNVNERFAPLIGLDLRLKGNIGTTVQFNQTNQYTLSTTNYAVSKRHGDELAVSINYQKQGLKLPFVRNKLNNRVTFALALQRSVNDERRFLLREAVSEAVTVDPTTGQLPTFTSKDAQSGNLVNVLQSTTRLTVTPTIGYQFSNSVQGNFSLKYEQFDSRDTRTPSFMNITGLFTVRVSIASN